jgi:ribosomal protein S18 acetylase RimI-like enzyme
MTLASQKEVDLGRAEQQRMFPQQWLSGPMEPTHVGQLCGDYEPAGSTTYAMVRPDWLNKQFMELAAGGATSDYHEPWTAPDAAYWKMAVYLEGEGPVLRPLGAVVFQPNAKVSLSTSRVVSLQVRLALFWVAPELQGRGFGKHLAAHLIRYLQAHPVTSTGRSIARKGLNVAINDELRPAGCRRLVDYVYEHFEDQRERLADGIASDRVNWPVRHVARVRE